MFRFPSRVLIASLQATAAQLRSIGTPEALFTADRYLEWTNPQRIHIPSKRGAHTRKCGRTLKSNRSIISARTKRKHRRAA